MAVKLLPLPEPSTQKIASDLMDYMDLGTIDCDFAHTKDL